jgi:hypothetical protein
MKQKKSSRYTVFFATPGTKPGNYSVGTKPEKRAVGLAEICPEIKPG